METENFRPRSILYLLLGMMLLLLSFRFLLAFRFFWWVFLLLALLGIAIFIVFQYLQKKRLAKTPEGQIQLNIAYCEAEIMKHSQAMHEIQRSIQEIAAKRNAAEGLSPQMQAESQSLIEAFQEEWELRKVKVTFFENCMQKLRQLQDAHALSKELLTKKDQLLQLKDQHYEDIAQMEALQSEMEWNSAYFETILDLSHQMSHSPSASDAHRLQLELEEKMKIWKK